MSAPKGVPFVRRRSPARAGRAQLATFVLAWNPTRWTWEPHEFEQTVITTSLGIRVEGRWSVGGRRGGIDVGDRAFLLRQHSDRGIVASAYFTSGVVWDDHWDGSGRSTTYADLEWDVVVDPIDRLAVDLLKLRVPAIGWDRIQGSGVVVADPSDEQLEVLWAEHLGGVPFRSPEEVSPGTTFPEGDVTRVEVNRYERDRGARQACIAHWGTSCSVCDFDFESVYGAVGKGFIHVHHLEELSTVGRGYRVDPIKDLRPVCPNCHAMLHSQVPVLTVAQLKKRMGRRL